MSNAFSDLMKEAWTAAKRPPTLNLFVECWTTLVGPDIALHTRPVGLSDGKLDVEVRSGWIGELNKRKEVIRARMDSRLPFTAPQLVLHAADGFPPVSLPSVEEIVPSKDARTSNLPEGLQEQAERILWHIRKESE